MNNRQTLSAFYGDSHDLEWPGIVGENRAKSNMGEL